ncbi:hypothetical protein ACNKHS_07450 [Shigella flexneri]
MRCAKLCQTCCHLQSIKRRRTLPAREFQHVDKYVLYNRQRGSGQRFDWSLLDGQSLGNVLLAGGLGDRRPRGSGTTAAPDLILILL